MENHKTSYFKDNADFALAAVHRGCDEEGPYTDNHYISNTGQRYTEREYNHTHTTIKQYPQDKISPLYTKVKIFESLGRSMGVELTTPQIESLDQLYNSPTEVDTTMAMTMFRTIIFQQTLKEMKDLNLTAE